MTLIILNLGFTKVKFINMTQITDEDVVWRTYPGYPFIEVNQLGEIRVKDRTIIGKDGKKHHFNSRILKQEDNGRGYMRVKFRLNGKTVHIYVHRAVAICFLPNPNNYPEVNHIDNNPKNNVVSNLEWCTHEYNEAYKKKFGSSQAELFGRPVFAVNLETGKVLWFESQHEAARQLGVGNSQICAVVKGKLNQAGGFWFTENESEISEEKIREIKDNMNFLGGVIAVNPETSEVLWFKTQSEAACQLGVGKGNIYSVLKGKRHKTGGCWFTYADKNAVEKTRGKFGDEIAREVEKILNDFI